MNCIELKQPAVLVRSFRLENNFDKEKVYKCFRELYYDYYTKFCHKTIFIRYSFLPEKKEELLKDSFNDGFVAFYNYIKEKGFEEKSTVDTVFIEFCKRYLWAQIKKQYAHNRYLFAGDPEMLLNNENHHDSDKGIYIQDEIIDIEIRYHQLARGLAVLGERCKNLITWRKLKKMNNAEIAELSGIKEKAVNNEVFRCMNKLKSIVDSLQYEKERSE